MEWFICILLLAVGIVLIVKGGDWFVDASSWIAEVSGVPRFIIGATIVSIATTLPEILVSTIGAAEGNIGLAIGNAVGSVNANIGLILGVSILAVPAIIDRKKIYKKILILSLAILLLFIFCFVDSDAEHRGQLVVWQAVIVIAVFVLYFIENIFAVKKEAMTPKDLEDDLENIDVTFYENYDHLTATDADVEAMKSNKKIRTRRKPTKKEIIKNVILFILGAGGIAGGAILLNKYGQQLAEMCNVPGDIIGVTIVAVGTSLPELTTAIISVAKKKGDMSVGNIIGANIIDITLILPLCAFISGGSLPVNPQTIVLDLPICLAFAAVAFIPSLFTGKIQRWQGALLLVGYIAYITLLVLNVNSVGIIHIFAA